MKTINELIGRNTPFNEAIEIAIANGFTKKGINRMEFFNNKRERKLEQVLYSEDGGIQIINMRGTYNYTEFMTWENKKL